MDPFIADRADGLVIYAGRLYWSTNCGDAFSPPQSRVKSWLIGDARAPISTLYMPSTCQGDRVASSSVAIDNAAVYWLTGSGQVVRLPLNVPMTTPAVLCATRSRNIGGSPSTFCIVTDGRNVYWSEGTSLYTVPNTGGTAAELTRMAGPDPIRSVRLGADGLLYVLAGTTLVRVRTATGSMIEQIAGSVVAFALGSSRLAWVAKRSGTRTASILSAPLIAPTSATNHYTTDGIVDASGAVVIDSVAIDDRRVYWHELKNITGGPIFRCGLTAGSAAVAISDYQLANTLIITDGRYLFWTDYNTGLFRIEVGAPSAVPAVAAPGRAWITGTEPVQSIQTVDSRVPLMAHKRTFVRVYCRSEEDARGAWSGVTARLAVEGFSRWHSPINQYAITVSPSGSDRSMLTDSFLFELDPEETHPGTRSLQVQLFPPAGRPQLDITNHSATRMLVFGPAGSEVSPSVYAARYRYRNVPVDVQRARGLSSSIWPEWPLSAYDLHIAVAEQALPVASLRMEPWPVVAEVDYNTPDGRVGAGYETARAWAIDQIDAAHPEGGKRLFLIQPEIEAGAAHGADSPTGRGNHVINFQHNTTEPGITLIHELFHSFGIGHTPSVGAQVDPNFPRSNDSMGPEVALSVVPPGVGGATAEMISMISGERADGSILRYEIMSYAWPSWVSLYTYNRGMHGATGGSLVAPSTLEGGG